MSKKGWVKLQRQFVNWQWFKDGPTLHVFVYMLCNANNAANFNCHGTVLQPGQLITGRKAIATACGLTERAVRTAINHLKTTNEITTTTTNKFTVVTLTNWAKYQNKGAETTNKTTNKQSNERPTTDHIQEYKEYKEDKEVRPTPEILPDVIPGWQRWMLETQTFQEMALMSVAHIQRLTFAQLTEYINRFAIKQRAGGRNYANNFEARAHFTAWLETELRKAPVPVETNNRPSAKRLQ